ncbi:MAG TPA: hypothetical protein VH253_18075 [Phycisphaerae bacterium]|nr:hypothetical protein [Phycisphaerae bacterium]
MGIYARGNPARWWRGRRIGRGSPAPLGMFVSPARRIASAGALVGLAGLIGGVWYITNPDRISRLSEALLSNVLGGKVTVASGHLSWSGTLVLQGVSLRTDDSGAGGHGASMPVFAADQIEARFDWASLLEGRLRATQLTAVGPTLYLVEDQETGRWNYEDLRGAKNKPEKPEAEKRPVALPVILLRDARVEWAELRGGSVKGGAKTLYETGSTIVDGQLTPAGGGGAIEGRPAALYAFEVQQRAGGGSGVAGGGSAGGALVTGSWDTRTHEIVAETATALDLSESLKRSLPREAREFWESHQLKGRLGRLQVSFDETAGLVVTVDLAGVSLVQPVTPPTGLAAGTRIPVAVQDITGRVMLAVTQQRVALTGLRGRVAGQDFVIDGDVDGESGAASQPSQPDLAKCPFGVTVRMPALDLGRGGAPYPAVLMAFEPIQDALQRVEPGGPMDVSITAARKESGGPITLDGRVECHDARLRFAYFPYPLHHMNGEIRFDEKLVRFEHVTALAGEDQVVIDGSAATYEKNPAIDFTVRCPDATFDERMAACLPEKYQAVWDQFDVHGRGALECRVTHASADPAPPKISLEVDVTSGSGYMRAMPYRFTGANGTLVFNADSTQIKHMVLHDALDPHGTVTIDGVVRHPGGDVSNLRPELSVAASVPIDSNLLHAMPEEYTDKLHGAAVTGQMAFNGTYRRVGGAGTASTQPARAEVTGALSVADGSYRSADGQIAIGGLSGEAMLQPGGIDLRKAGGRVLGIDLSASGRLDLDRGTADLQLAAQQRDFVLPENLPAMVPEAARQMWKRYQPAGKVDLDASAKVVIGADGGPPAIQDYAAKIAAKGVAIRNSAWPEDVQDIVGNVAISPGKVEMRGMGGRSGGLRALWEGTYDVATGACHVAGSAQSDGLPGRWPTLLPQGVRDILDAYKITGKLSAEVASLDRTATGQPWSFTGALGAMHLDMQGGIPLGLDAGKLALKGTFGDQGLAMNGALSLSNLKVTGKVIDTLECKVGVDPRQKQLRLDDINGTVAGGKLHGDVLGVFDASGRYEANMVLSDAELNRLLLPANATAEDRAKLGNGQVTATLAVQQTFGQRGERTGRGDLVVKDGVLYNVPLAMGLLQVATLRLPVAHSFDGASMTYYLRDNRVTFERIILESKGVDLAGNGTLTLHPEASNGMGAGQLDLNFVTESPNDWNIPILSTILKTTRRELLQLSVTGTVDNPKVTPVPFSTITGALRNLLPIPHDNGK